MQRGKSARLAIALGIAFCALPIAEAAAAASFVVVGTKAPSGLGVVRIYTDNDANRTYETLADEYTPFSSSSLTPDGLRVAAGDFDGDTNDEVAVAAGETDAVRIYELTSSGEIGALMQKVAGFAPGSYVAAGDVDADGRDELAVSTDPGSNTKVKIFRDVNENGTLEATPTENFNAYPGEDGGARVAFGNVNNSGGDELVVGPGPDAGLPVKIYRDADLDRLYSDEPILDSFVPYGASYAGGTYVAAGPIENAGGNGAEVVVSAAATQNKNVLIRTDSNANGLVSDNPPFDQLAPPYGGSYQKGVRVAAGDTDDSSFFHEVITAPGGASQPVKIFDDTADTGSLLSDNPVADSFGATTAATGSFVAFARTVSPITYGMAGPPLFLADNATTESNLVVPQSAGIIRDIDVGVGISHTFDGDLTLALLHRSPSGSTQITLWSNVGGTCDGFLVALNDEAGTDVGAATCSTSGPISGSFNLEATELLSPFDNTDASGTWRLIVTDGSVNDTGTLHYWNLRISY